jgi:hypothetical protein
MINIRILLRILQIIVIHYLTFLIFNSNIITIILAITITACFVDLIIDKIFGNK